MPPQRPQASSSFRNFLSRSTQANPVEANATEARRAEPRKSANPTRARRADRNEQARSRDDARAGAAEGEDEDSKTTKKSRAKATDPAAETPAGDGLVADATIVDDGSVDPDASPDYDDEAAAALAAAAAQSAPGTACPDDEFAMSEADPATAGRAAPIDGRATAEKATNPAGEGEATDVTAEAGFALPPELSADAEAEGEPADGEAPAPPRPTATRGKGSGFGTGALGEPSRKAELDAEAIANEQVAGSAKPPGPVDPALAGEIPAAPLAADPPRDAVASKPTADRADGLMPPPADVSHKSQVAAREAAPAPAAEVPPEVRFAELNHDKVVTGVRAELLPNGGSMQIRLDPPELGDLLVSIQMRDGVTTATFQTSNDKASTLLSHSLSDLRASLEAQGVNVDRLHVQQTPKDPSSDAGNAGQQGASGRLAAEEREAGRREQQRKDMVQRMWEKLAGKGDPLDLVG